MGFRNGKQASKQGAFFGLPSKLDLLGISRMFVPTKSFWFIFPGVAWKRVLLSPNWIWWNTKFMSKLYPSSHIPARKTPKGVILIAIFWLSTVKCAIMKVEQKTYFQTSCSHFHGTTLKPLCKPIWLSSRETKVLRSVDHLNFEARKSRGEREYLLESSSYLNCVWLEVIGWK